MVSPPGRARLEPAGSREPFRSGQGEFDLSSVPAGAHDVRLLAWATDPGATLAAVTLPRLAFGH